MDDHTLMQYDDADAVGQYRTPVMPSGNQYVYSGMWNKNRLWVHNMDVAAMEAIGFSVVDIPKVDQEQFAQAAAEVQAVLEQEQKVSELVAAATEETTSATESKSNRRK